MLPGDRIAQIAERKIEILGTYVKIKSGKEASVDRSKYTDVKSRNSSGDMRIKAFPIRFNPSEKEMMKAGIVVPVEVIFWIPKAVFDRMGYKYDEIQESSGVILHEKINQSYLISKKNIVAQNTNSFVYLTIGANRN